MSCCPMLHSPASHLDSELRRLTRVSKIWLRSTSRYVRHFRMSHSLPGRICSVLTSPFGGRSWRGMMSSVRFGASIGYDVLPAHPLGTSRSTYPFESAKPCYRFEVQELSALGCSLWLGSRTYILAGKDCQIIATTS